MSGFTSEGTEFENGACRACGGRSYGLAEDGPRCHGCERFVLKDDSVGLERGNVDISGFSYAVQPVSLDSGSLTLAKIDALMGELAPLPPYLSKKTRELLAVFDQAFFSDLPETSKPKRKKRKPLKTAEVMAEVESILSDGRRDRDSSNDSEPRI